MIIAVDFDGTLCDHRFPDIGQEVPGAFDALRAFQEAGAKLILFTMRSDLQSDHRSDEGHKADSPFLSNAVAWCEARGIRFWGVNQNPDQHKWTESPKPYAHIYIDDAAFGCPLREMPRVGSRKAVDWSVVGPAVLSMLTTERPTL